MTTDLEQIRERIASGKVIDAPDGALLLAAVDEAHARSEELLRDATRLRCELEHGATVLMRVAGEMVRAAGGIK